MSSDRFEMYHTWTQRKLIFFIYSYGCLIRNLFWKNALMIVNVNVTSKILHHLAIDTAETCNQINFTTIVLSLRNMLPYGENAVLLIFHSFRNIIWNNVRATKDIFKLFVFQNIYLIEMCQQPRTHGNFNMHFTHIQLVHFSIILCEKV